MSNFITTQVKQKRIKILYVHHSGILAGAPKSLSYIISNLDQQKYTPILLTIEKGPSNEYFRKKLNCLIISNFNIRPFHGSTVVKLTLKLILRNLMYLIPSIISSVRTLRRIKPELIHLNSSCLIPVAIAAKLLGFKTICHLREPAIEGIIGWPLRFFNNLCVDAYISICQNDLNSMGNIPKNIRRQVIYNHTASIKKRSLMSIDNAKISLGLRNDQVVFLYLARFNSSNGWEFLIESAQEIISQQSNSIFILVGANKETTTSLNTSNRIKVFEFSESTEAYLHAADVFICPFTKPHFSRGVIEAAGYGIPSIGNNIGGVNELIEHNNTGLIYNNKDEFLSACQQLADNKTLRDKLGDNSYDFAMKNFNSSINLDLTFDFYETLLSDKI